MTVMVFAFQLLKVLLPPSTLTQKRVPVIPLLCIGLESFRILVILTLETIALVIVAIWCPYLFPCQAHRAYFLYFITGGLPLLVQCTPSQIYEYFNFVSLIAEYDWGSFKLRGYLRNSELFQLEVAVPHFCATAWLLSTMAAGTCTATRKICI